MDDECIFCKIEETDNRKIYEDDVCFVIPDKYPTDYGHLLVVSKTHYNDMLHTPDKIAAAMYLVAKRYAKILEEKLGAEGAVITTNIGKQGGQIIFHTHVHVTPKYSKRRTGFMPHMELTTEAANELKKKLAG